MVLLENVFGVSADPVLSYVERVEIDGKFTEALKTPKHIVVYGSSKQGKTALVSRHLPYQENVVVRLSPASNVEDIYSSLLRQAGAELEISKTEEKAGEISATLGIKAKAKIWLFGEGEMNASGSAKSTDKTQRILHTISFNLAVAQDVAELLTKTGFQKKVILENFHYLAEDKQRQLAFDLRSFQEMGIIFVILGVWRQKDKMRIYCSDLTDRVIDIPVEPWETADFTKVAKAGSVVLNIAMTSSVISKCVENAFGSVGVFQELMKEVCVAAKIKETQKDEVELSDIALAELAIKEKADQYCATHQQALELISSGNVTHSKEKEKKPLHLPYYLVMAILALGSEGFKFGASRADITAQIKSMHHRKNDVRPTDMTNLLHNLSALQHKKGINPPLIDYDIGKKTLYAIDSTFFFFLKNCNLQEISEELASPL